MAEDVNIATPPAASAPAAPVAPPPSIPDRSEGELRNDVADFESVDGNVLDQLFGLGAISAVETPAADVPVEQTPLNSDVAAPPPTPPEDSATNDGSATATPPPAAVPETPPTPPVVTPPPTMTQEQFNQTLTFINSEEFQRARVVAQELFKDPVAFVERYAPTVRDHYLTTAAAAKAPDLQTFARSYAEVKLAEKYGDTFVYDPAEARYPESDHAKYLEDRTLFLMEAGEVFREKRNELTSQQQRQQQEMRSHAANALVSVGVPQERTDEVLAIAQTLNLTPAEQFEMMFSYMKTKGKIPGVIATSQSATPTNGEGSRTPDTRDALPVPGIQSVPGRGEMTQGHRDIIETFPMDLLTEELL